MQNNTRPGVVWGRVDALEWGEYPEAGRSYLPHACMQCDDPACVASCPTGASYQREDGITLVDYERCICCGQCVVACPYGARHINNEDKYWFEQKTPAPYEAEGVQRMNVAEKCNFCAGKVDDGGLPACVATCPGKARFFGDIDDPESDIAKKAAKATRVAETGFYYLPVKGMDASLITPVLTGNMSSSPKQDAKGQKNAEKSQKAEGSDATPVIIAAGAIAVAAGAGVGIGVSRSKAAKRKAAAATAGDKGLGKSEGDKEDTKKKEGGDR
jgi:Fe-S-cluster-containing dehydrogenase component